MELLKKYEGHHIGINYDHSADIHAAQLISTDHDLFSVMIEEKGLMYSYPVSTILSVAEEVAGANFQNGAQKPKFPAIVRVYPLVLL
jgi:hypothetical protein